MKATYILFVISFIGLLGCQSKQPANEKIVELNSQTDTMATMQSMEVYQASVPLDINLLSFFADDVWAYKAIENYYLTLADSNKIISNEGIKAIFNYRDTLISQLSQRGSVEPVFTKAEQGLLSFDSMMLFLEAFEKIGIHIITIEGMYSGLERAPLLNNALEHLATEDFRLAEQLKNAYGMTIGGEYPYLGLEWNYEVILAGEKLLVRYPQSKYTKDILSLFENSLTPLVDIHKVQADEFDIKYLVSGFSTDPYPNITDTAFHHQFVKKYPTSVFAPIISRILNNPSTFSEAANQLYIVKVPYLEGEINQITYFLNGIDIAHTLYLNENNPQEITLAYRYFDSKEKAEEALKQILPLVPQAEIIEYKIN